MTSLAMPKLKVLHVIKTLAAGGAEANLLNIVRATDRQQVEIHVAYSVGGPFEAALRRQAVRLYKFATEDHKVRSPASIGIILGLAGYLRRHRIRIVHTHNYSAHVWGALAAKLAGARVVEHVHDSRYEDADYLRARGIGRPEQFKQAKYFARLSHRIVVLTRRNRAYLTERLNVSCERIALMRNGIFLDSRHEGREDDIRRRLSIPADRTVILAVGRLSPEKHLEFVVEIAQQMADGGRELLFLIAGDGPQRGEIEAKITKAGLEGRVQLLGFYENVPELLAISEMLIQPSLLELHSIVMLEAMSFGVPVLTSRGVGCHDEFISHGKNGFLLDPYRASDWAATICYLYRNPGLADEVGRCGRKLAEEQCDIRDTARRFENLYLELVDHAG